MSKPTALPTFDTNLTNQTATTAGHKTDGYANNEVPTAGEFNYWMNLVYLWIAWVSTQVAIVTRVRAMVQVAGGTWTQTSALAGNVDIIGLTSSGANTSFVDLDIPLGYKLSTLTFNAFGNAVATMSISYETAPVTAAAATNQGTITTGAITSTAADIVMNMLATTNLVASVTVAAAGGTYTRTTGSFITDGFFQGQIIQWSGFTNSGNNAVKTITALSATVMTVSTAGLVNETAVALATCNGVSPTIDNTIGGTQLKLVASATGLGVSKLRYTCVPQ